MAVFLPAWFFAECFLQLQSVLPGCTRYEVTLTEKNQQAALHPKLRPCISIIPELDQAGL